MSKLGEYPEDGKVSQVFLWLAVLILAVLHIVRVSGLQGEIELQKAEVRTLRDEVHSKVYPEECTEVMKEKRMKAALPPNLSNRLGMKIITAVLQAEKKYNLDPFLTLAVIERESGFNPDVVSSKGALGLMQVRPFWIGQIPGVTSKLDLMEVEGNVAAGAWILHHYISTFKGNQHLGLLAYNRGLTSVVSSLSRGEDVSYSNYPIQVTERQKALSSQDKL